ncbi:MAG: DUF6799 domain-containing protein [Parafilimonas sp.]
MKKIICMLAVICISHSLFAQDTSMNKSMMQNNMSKMKDCLYMKDGKMMAMMHGKSMMMKKDMTLQNGTMVMKDGTVKMKDGTTKKLNENECVYMDGMTGNMEMNDDMMTDSTDKQ